MSETPAFRPALPAVESLLLRSEPAGLGGALSEALKPGGAGAPIGHASDPEDLITSALAILAGHKSAPRLPLNSPPARVEAPPSEARLKDRQPGALPLQQRVLSDGTPCPLPIRYFDAQLLITTFIVERSRAATLLKNTGLTAVPQATGKAVVSFGCFQYRKTDIGPYNEVGLGILATAPGNPIPALYVAHLPVDTAIANRAGHEIWGYNKFVAAIDIAGNADGFAMTIRDPDGAGIAQFGGRLGASVPVPPTDIVTFSMHDGRLIRTVIQAMTPSQLGDGSGFSLKIGESRHPMADDLRSLGLDNISPVLVQYADPFQSMLFPGQIA